MKKQPYHFIIVLMVGGILLVYGIRSWISQPGSLVQTIEKQFGSLTIRDQIYNEEEFVMGGSHHHISSKNSNHDWVEIFEFRHDDHPEGETNFFIKKLDEAQFAVAIGWVIATSNDNGTTWNIWNAEKDAPNWLCCNYKLISDINIETSGKWVLKLHPIQNRLGEGTTLFSHDNGKTWNTHSSLL